MAINLGKRGEVLPGWRKSLEMEKPLGKSFGPVGGVTDAGCKMQLVPNTSIREISEDAEADDPYAYVGQRLRTFRKERGLTQAEVGRVISVSPQQYQKYEDAQSKCSLTSLIALAEFYGVALGALLPGVTEDVAEGAGVQPEMPSEADLLARLVGSFVRLHDIDEKMRLVQLVEAIQSAHERSE